MKMLARAAMLLPALLLVAPAMADHASSSSSSPFGYAPEQACVTWTGATIGSGALVPCAGGSAGTASSTSGSGAIANANQWQSVLAPNSSRKGCLIQNTSAASLLAFLGAPGSATAAASISIPSGGSFSCANPGGLVVADQISLTSTLAGATFVVVTQ